MIFCIPKNHTVPKLESQELKAWNSHVTSGILMLEYVLTLIGQRLHWGHTVPFSTCSRYTSDRVNVSIEPHHGKRLPIHHFHLSYHFGFCIRQFYGGFQGHSICLSACLVTVVKQTICCRTIYDSENNVLWISTNKCRQQFWTPCWPNWAIASLPF